MNREEKTALIDGLSESFAATRYFYVTDTSSMSVEKVNKLRRICFAKGIKLQVVKNSVIRKALEKVEQTTTNRYTDLIPALKGISALMFTDNGSEVARMIKEFREGVEGGKPARKAAFIDNEVYVGDDQLDTLTKIKSKQELLGELIGLLQSPIQKLLGALQFGGNTIAGVLKTLEERGNE
jgi:large subunit ribosomal protein L10